MIKRFMLMLSLFIFVWSVEAAYADRENTPTTANAEYFNDAPSEKETPEPCAESESGSFTGVDETDGSGADNIEGDVDE